MKIEVNGTTLPVDPKFIPICTLDSNGNPTPLSGSGGGGTPGGATEAKQNTLIALATKTLDFHGGRLGSEILSDTEDATGSFTGLRCLADSEIASITSSGTGGIRNAASLVGRSLPAGSSVWGRFTAIELASGCVQLIDEAP